MLTDYSILNKYKMVEEGSDINFGARPLKRTIQDEIENIKNEQKQHEIKFDKKTGAISDGCELSLNQEKI